MATKNKETIIISLGGSLVAPGGIDLEFLKRFKSTLSKYLRTRRFFIIVGGGKICRVYQKALLEFGAELDDREWIGIDVTKLNAEVVRHVFAENSFNKIVTDPNRKVKTNKDIIIGAGWKPGASTDRVSVLIAKTYGIKTIVNLTNTDYVYDKDPRDFPEAKPLEKVDWESFELIVGDKWVPGLSKPFDPIATKLATKLKLKVVMINGQSLDRLENFLENRPFVGTIIS